MTAKTIDCIECGESVPYGRLSCPACGALLASVTGSPVVASPRPEPTADVAAADEPEPFLLPDDEPVPPVPWSPPEAPAPLLAGRPYRSIGEGPSDIAATTGLPSAYRGSGLVLSGAAAGGSGWQATSAPAASLALPAAQPATSTIRARVGPLDPARFAEIAGWFVGVGATMAVLGFLLPWSRVVIGARSVGGYTDMWGLASPTHIVVLVAALVVLALSILRTSVPIWVRSGVLPLALGSLLIGLAWPYQVGPLGADVGVLVVGLGGVALVIGGVVATWATRHVEEEPAV